MLPLATDVLLATTTPPEDETDRVKAGVKADADPAVAPKRTEE